MGRLFLLVVLEWSLWAGASIAAGQQAGEAWPRPGPPPSSTAPSVDPGVRADIYLFGPGALVWGNPGQLTVERLPPVEGYWSVAPVYPPVAHAWEPTISPDVSQAVAADQERAGGEAATDSSENKDESTDQPEKKDIPEIEGDPLPRMLETVVVERIPWYHLDMPWLEPWDGSFEMGLNGSSGNSETFDVRLGAEAKRKTKRHSIMFDLDYHKNTNEAVETINRLYFEGRYERLSETKPWTWFFQQTTDYDEFQPWNVRVVSSTGIGYRFLDDEITTLTARLGSGFSQEVGGSDQQCVPEMQYGMEYEHRMTTRQKIRLSVEYFPDLTAYNEFRLVNKADWEILLDAEMNLSLKFSAIDRYNYPNPGGKLNDVDYAIVLLWSF
ncbi:MAG: DUF481 domain-containing protein [Pirellulales bacterium]|nr:DUF481 domain-containing protein [Pirellulales bacterium]